MSVHERIAKECGLMKSNVKCETCGKVQMVNGADCLAHGWPECHGYTMTLLPKTLPPTTEEGK